MSKRKENPRGLIFNIQRFSIHDGPGIRTTIFFKGCPLACLWCCNPEGQKSEKELLVNKNKCVLCKKCIEVCPSGANSLLENEILHDPSLCTLCEKCIKQCLPGARKIYGKLYSTGEIIDILEKDENFFRNTSGGVTLSGGEPIYQYGFISELLLECKKNYINTAIETCGYCDWEKLENLSKITDLIIFDLKHVDDIKHKKHTGKSNDKILGNLEKLSKIKKNILLRITQIPGFNDSEEDQRKIKSFIDSLEKDIDIEYLKYHEFGKFKYGLLNRKYYLDNS